MTYRYFTSPKGFTTDAAYMIHRDEDSDGVIVTKSGEERAPNSLTPWPLDRSINSIPLGWLVEITMAEAYALLDNPPVEFVKPTPMVARERVR